mmetsp:Transcript_64169/g.150613  ORF Transcript_64169/g.150613 Transcript_64169/m.150613 type:complete len:287 (-) Transcript_64169:1909-2769(-)
MEGLRRHSSRQLATWKTMSRSNTRTSPRRRRAAPSSRRTRTRLSIPYGPRLRRATSLSPMTWPSSGQTQMTSSLRRSRKPVTLRARQAPAKKPAAPAIPPAATRQAPIPPAPILTATQTAPTRAVRVRTQIRTPSTAPASPTRLTGEQTKTWRARGRCCGGSSHRRPLPSARGKLSSLRQRRLKTRPKTKRSAPERRRRVRKAKPSMTRAVKVRMSQRSTPPRSLLTKSPRSRSSVVEKPLTGRPTWRNCRSSWFMLRSTDLLSSCTSTRPWFRRTSTTLAVLLLP